MDIKARRQTNRHIKGLIVKCSWSYKNEMQMIMTIYKANVKSSQKEIQAEININNILWRPILTWFEWNQVIQLETWSSLMGRPSKTLFRINLMSVKCYLQALVAWTESERKLMEQGIAWCQTNNTRNKN